MDKILRLCTESEKRGRTASAEEGGAGAGRRGSPAGRRNKHPGIIQIDPDTAVMPASRAAIFRAAGAACFAVDEVRGRRGEGETEVDVCRCSPRERGVRVQSAFRSILGGVGLLSLPSGYLFVGFLVVLSLGAGL